MSLPSLQSPLRTEVDATTWKSRFSGGLIAASGIAMLSIAHGPTGLLARIIEGIGLTLISIGSVSLFFNLALRRNVQREMMRLVGIKQAVAQSRIVEGTDARSIDWRTILSGRSHFSILLQDPQTWIDNNLDYLLASARSQSVGILMLMPDPRGPAVGELAAYMRKASLTVQTSVEDAAARVESAWNEHLTRGHLHVGSSIHVKYCAASPKYSLVVADGHAVMVYDGALEKGRIEGPYSVRFEGNRNETPIRWLVEQIEKAPDCKTQFFGEVK